MPADPPRPEQDDSALVLGDPQNEQTLGGIVAAVGKATFIKVLGTIFLAGAALPGGIYLYLKNTITGFDVRISQAEDAIDTVFAVTTDKIAELKREIAQIEKEFNEFTAPGARFSREDWERARDNWNAKLDFLKLEIHRKLDQIQAGIPPPEVVTALQDLEHRVTVLEVEKKAHDWFSSEHKRGKK